MENPGSKLEMGNFVMNVPETVKPAIWGMIGGAVVATVVGFAWGGWVTGGTAEDMTAASAESAVVEAFTPLCFAQAKLQPDQIVLLKEESNWKREDFVIKAGWVTNVSEKYRSAVADACASIAVKDIDASATKPTG